MENMFLCLLIPHWGSYLQPEKAPAGLRGTLEGTKHTLVSFRGSGLCAGKGGKKNPNSPACMSNEHMGRNGVCFTVQAPLLLLPFILVQRPLDPWGPAK